MTVQQPSNARPNPAEQRRKAELAKIHLAKKALAMDDAVYRDVLQRAGGKRSAAELDGAGRARVLEEMKRLGFKDRPRQARRAGKRPIAEGEMQAKIRALWLSLYHLGEVGDPSEAALAAFVQRMTKTPAAPDGVAALQWLDPYTANKAILALRGWCERVGLAQPTAEQLAEMRSWRNLAGMEPIDIGFVAKVQLIQLLWKRLEAAGAFRHPVFASVNTWCSTRYGVSAPWFLQPREADAAVEQLGKWLRRVREQSNAG